MAMGSHMDLYNQLLTKGCLSNYAMKKLVGLGLA